MDRSARARFPQPGASRAAGLSRPPCLPCCDGRPGSARRDGVVWRSAWTSGSRGSPPSRPEGRGRPSRSMRASERRLQGLQRELERPSARTTCAATTPTAGPEGAREHRCPLTEVPHFATSRQRSPPGGHEGVVRPNAHIALLSRCGSDQPQLGGGLRGVRLRRWDRCTRAAATPTRNDQGRRRALARELRAARRQARGGRGYRSNQRARLGDPHDSRPSQRPTPS